MHFGVAFQLSLYVGKLAPCFARAQKPERNLAQAGSSIVIGTSDDAIVSSSFKEPRGLCGNET
jgi:hypothetical protein